MLISIIIPTLGTRETEMLRLLDSLQNQTYQEFEIIVVSQDHHQTVEGLLNNYRPKLNIQQVKSDKKGLSLARNLGLPLVSGEVVTFSDDDCWYPEDAFQKVIQSIKGGSRANIFCFQIFDPYVNEYYKSYPNTQIEKLNVRQIFQRSSIEIFVRLGDLKREELLFNERFGLGAQYPSGEENIMLSNLHKKGYLITYINEVVVYHNRPSQKSRLNLAAFKSKGPLFKEIFGPYMGAVMLTAMFIKKYRNLDSPIEYYIEALKEMASYKKG